MPVIRSHDVTLRGSAGDLNIVLRPLSDAHLPLLYRWNSDPEVLYWTEGGEDIVRSYDADTVNRIYGGVSQAAHCFLIEVDGVPVGECWLQRMNLSYVSAQYPSLDVRRIDMAIGEKEYWGKGIGTAFVGLLVEFAFAVEGVDVLHCFAEDYNVRSVRVWLKNGFRLAHSEDLPQPQKGTRQHHFVLTRSEWTETSARPIAVQDEPLSRGR